MAGPLGVQLQPCQGLVESGQGPCSDEACGTGLAEITRTPRTRITRTPLHVSCSRCQGLAETWEVEPLGSPDHEGTAAPCTWAELLACGHTTGPSRAGHVDYKDVRTPHTGTAPSIGITGAPHMGHAGPSCTVLCMVGRGQAPQSLKPGWTRGGLGGLELWLGPAMPGRHQGTAERGFLWSLRPPSAPTGGGWGNVGGGFELGM